MTSSAQAGSPASLVVESGSAALAAARPRWSDLAARSGAGYFQTWEWVTAWHDVLEPRAEIVLIRAVDDQGRWTGLMPLAFLSRRLHRRMPASVAYLGVAGSGRGAGDHLGPLACAAGLRPTLVAATVRLAGGRPVYLESLDPTVVDEVNGALQGRPVHRVACPRVDLAGLTRIEDAWPAKVRKNLRRRQRLLAEEGIIGRWVDASDEMVARQ